jgi:RNA polymerase sigma-70 factor, ECF subfamily
VTAPHENDWLAERFEAHRTRLTTLAYRMLGSASEADDAVQEAWLRLGRTDADAIDNLGGWLTTVLSRVCLNVLQARRTRPEVPLDDDAPEIAAPDAGAAGTADPEHEAVLADTVGLALLVVLDTLSPAERVAFVLHDLFAVPFEDIAPIVGRSVPATRQLASRARRRIRREDPDPEADRLRQATLVDAFLAAARAGEFERLLALLDPEVVLRADVPAVALGAAPETRGRAEVGVFCRRARGATPAFLDGRPALVWMRDGAPRVIYRFTTSRGRITAIDLVADPEHLRRVDLVAPVREWPEP